MFKVLITQIVGERIVGKSVLVEDFKDLDSAKKAALDYSQVYSRQVFQIRKYDDKKANVISFSESDTGSVVYEKN